MTDSRTVEVSWSEAEALLAGLVRALKKSLKREEWTAAAETADKISALVRRF